MSTQARRANGRLGNAGAMLLGLVILIWTLAPLYNMVLVAVQEKEDVFSTNIWPPNPTLHAFQTVFNEGYWYLANYWRQMGNSLLIGVIVALLTLAIGSATSYAIMRLRIRIGWLLTNAALLTYVIPMSFLAIPFYRIMSNYGLVDSYWSVIAVEVTFATPYAIFIFCQYSASIPHELDEAARIDGASPPQIFVRIYLPLMAPALVAVGTYALLLAWNEYLYAFLLLSSDATITVPVVLGKFLNSDEAPWNYLMAASIIYALPPLVIYYAFRRFMTAGLTMGGVKG
ncbi:carbohydrate ABC transporter permease [Limobrevibacterium gyesilva]|uniref:Carbohydrate ABC transporter permease n=1 Tax=Limobrevibacterium gyesilva TaxID=2991712 RepID=A0AA41YM51_9PROT|nr:carbohydrate ABC transporter permease [Limobrevibacterium gyesilva]